MTEVWAWAFKGNSSQDVYHFTFGPGCTEWWEQYGDDATIVSWEVQDPAEAADD